MVETAYAPRWEKNIEGFKSVLGKVTPQGLFDESRNTALLFDKLATAGKALAPNVKPSQVPQEAQLQFINNVIGTAFAAALKRDGWQIKSKLGEDLLFVNNGTEVTLHNLLPRLTANEFTREGWIEYCDENNLTGLKFA